MISKFLSVANVTVVCVGLMVCSQSSAIAHSLSPQKSGFEPSTCNDLPFSVTFSQFDSMAAKPGIPKRRIGGGSR